MVREHRSERGIKDSIQAIEKGDEVVYEAGSWRRKQPLRVAKKQRIEGYGVSHDEIAVRAMSSGGKKYSLRAPLDRETPPYDKEYGEITWLKVYEGGKGR